MTTHCIISYSLLEKAKLQGQNQIGGDQDLEVGYQYDCKETERKFGGGHIDKVYILILVEVT